MKTNVFMDLESFLYQGNAILSWLGMEKGGIGTVFCFYLLKMAVFTGLFYLLYKLLLSRESFSRFNRGVLLCAFVLSFVLPFWVFRHRMEVALPVMPVLQAILPDPDAVEPAVPDASARAAVALWCVYGFGVTGFLLRRLTAIRQVRRILFRSKKRNLPGGVVLAISSEAGQAFSTGRYVVLPEDLARSHAMPVVLRHEIAHVLSGHSWDLLLADMAGCLQWFNPFYYLLRRELQAVHEFEADRRVLEKGVDAAWYSMLLVRLSSGKKNLSGRVLENGVRIYVNSLNYNQLKNRITMMTKQKSKRNAKAKVLCFLPVVAAGLLLFGQKEYVYALDSPMLEGGNARMENSASLHEMMMPARTSASDTALGQKTDRFPSASLSEDLSKMALEVSAEVEEGVQEVLNALDQHMEFEVDGKTIGLWELVEGIQKGFYDADSLDVVMTAFRIKDDEGADRFEVSFDGKVTIMEENGGNVFTLTTVGSSDSASPAFSSSTVSVTRGEGEDEVHIYVDGKEVSKAEFEKLSPEDISAITVDKGETKALFVTTVGKAGSASPAFSSSTVSVTRGEGEDEVHIYVDGKEVSKAEFEKLSPEDISAITVDKGETKALFVTTVGKAGGASGVNVTTIHPDGSVSRNGKEMTAIQYYIDGEKVSEAEVQECLKPEYIKDIRVEKEDDGGEMSIYITLKPSGRKAMKAGKGR